jgi:hypothetical protein
MIPATPIQPIWAEQNAFIERVATLLISDDLATFIKDVNSWLQTPGVSNCASPHTLGGELEVENETALRSCDGQ